MVKSEKARFLIKLSIVLLGLVLCLAVLMSYPVGVLIKDNKVIKADRMLVEANQYIKKKFKEKRKYIIRSIKNESMDGETEFKIEYRYFYGLDSAMVNKIMDEFRTNGYKINCSDSAYIISWKNKMDKNGCINSN